MLQLDFFESGVGETIVITFPDGTAGLVDAHPSTVKSRPPILEILKDKKLRFVCLTHPHKDHGLDLLPVLKTLPVEELWHTLDDVSLYIQSICKTPSFKAEGNEKAMELKKGWAKFFLALINERDEKNIPEIPLRNDLRDIEHAGVKITVGSPTRFAQQEYVKAYLARLKNPQKDLPDQNSISAVLILRYGGQSVLLGSDALKPAWAQVKKVYFSQSVGKSRILKVPHHGAINSLYLRPNKTNISYLEFCADVCDAILFAGDCDHPDVNVKSQLDTKTRLRSFFDLTTKSAGSDPFRLNLHGGEAVDEVLRPVIVSQITVTIAPDGTTTIVEKPHPQSVL
jgi:hypothetical protein